MVQHKGKAFCIFSPAWIKFGIGGNHIIPLTSYEFHVNRYCIYHSLLERVWEILSLLYIFN